MHSVRELGRRCYTGVTDVRVFNDFNPHRNLFFKTLFYVEHREQWIA